MTFGYPPDIMSIICDYLHADITPQYNVVYRPSQYFEIVWEDDMTYMFPCRTS